MSNISPLAFVHPNAKIGRNVRINAFAYIDDNVVIGDDCVICPHVSILSGARIGNNNKFYDGCIISASPQDFAWKGDDSFVEIGDNNTIREQVIINRSIHKNGSTHIGNNTFIMAQTHIGHDSSIGDYCVLGNGVKIAGNVKVRNCSILSSGALVHENCEIGEYVFVKGGCRVNGHVPPFAVMAHNPIEYKCVNSFILRKANKTEDIIDDIAKCFRYLYVHKTSPFNAVKRMEIDVNPGPERDAVIAFVKGHDYKLAALPDIETL